MTASRTRFPWIVLILSLLVGAAGGLYYAWFVDPVDRVNIAPAQLEADDQDAYVLLISKAYLQDHDLEQARIRLAALGERDIAQRVLVQADAVYLRGANLEDVQALTTLAEALGAAPLAAEVFSGTAAPTPDADQTTPTPTFIGMPTLTPSPAEPTATLTPFIPTLTPTEVVIVDNDFELASRFILCEASHRAGLIQVFVYDVFGQGVPAVEVLVEWAGGKEMIFTGLKPAVDPGYADFLMEPDNLYTVTLSGLSEPVVGIDSTECHADNGELVTPTVQLIFEPSQPDEEED